MPLQFIDILKNKMKNKPVFSLFLAVIGGFVGLSMLPALARAAAPFNDDFDSYTTGELVGQGGWSGSLGVVSTSEYTTAPNGISSISASKTGITIPAGEFYYDIKPTAGSGYQTPVGQVRVLGDTSSFTIKAWVYQNNTNWKLAIPCNTYPGFCYVGDPLPFGEWHRIGVRWTSTTLSVNVDAGSWIDSEVAIDPGAGYKTINLQDQGYGTYFDTIDQNYDPTPPVIGGYDPILEPTDPAPDTSTIVDLDNFLVAGKLTIPTADTKIYENLSVIFNKPGAFLPANVLNIDLGELTAGENIEYSATTSIDYAAPGNNFYKVSYAVNGRTYAGSSLLNPVFSTTLLEFDNTWITDSTNPAPTSLFPLAVKPDAPALEDCSGYSGVDKIVCDMKNFIVGAFLPSDEAINQLSATMGAFNSKFPMNYLAEIFGSFSDIFAGVDESSAPSLTIMGNTQVVDFTLFTQDLGAGVTLGGTIKIILTFLILALFAFWGFNYMHRIF